MKLIAEFDLMPKKYLIENSKVAAVRLRKAATKEAEEIRKQKEYEDVCWKEHDKLILRKEQRKLEREEKRQKAVEKKQNNKLLLEKETLAVGKVGKREQPKITRAQIQSNVKQVKKLETAGVNQALLFENCNRMVPKEEEARNISDAITVLNDKPEKVDKNPEKRLKAAYCAFAENRLKQLKAENSSLRHSQLNDIVFKEWQKSSQNPLNKPQLC